MRKNSPQLKAVVNEFVKTHKRGTTFGNTVLQRYTASTKMLKSATSSDELAKFQRTPSASFRNTRRNTTSTTC